MCKRPPLGVAPKKTHEYYRFVELYRAASRYTDAGLPVSQDWLDEMYELYSGESPKTHGVAV